MDHEGGDHLMQTRATYCC